MNVPQESHLQNGHGKARRAAGDIGPAPTQSDAARILVVEDEPRLREMLLASLVEIGMSPTGVPSAESAIRTLEQASFAVCLVDLNLPGMGGMEFCELARQRWPAIQLVILTGCADIDAAKRAIRLEVVDFLTKPCGMDDLEMALSRARRRWLDHWLKELRGSESAEAAHAHLAASPLNADKPVVTSIESMERQLILAALERHPGNREAVAAEVGISVRKLYYRIQQYQRDGYVVPK